MHRAHLAALVAVGALACTHQRPLRTTTVAHRVTDEVKVYFRDGRTQVTTARPGPGGHTWLLGPTGDAVPVDDILAIRHVARAGTAIKGLGVGLVGGALLGGLLGWVAPAPSDCDRQSSSAEGGLCIDLEQEANVLGGLLLGGLAGAAIGLTVGAGGGETTWYGAPPPKPSTHVLIVPQAGGGQVGVGGVF